MVGFPGALLNINGKENFSAVWIDPVLAGLDTRATVGEPCVVFGCKCHHMHFLHDRACKQHL
jgi:hypothetical protein